MTDSTPPSRWRGRLMYRPHPNRDTLFAGNPSNLVNATENVQSILFDDLNEMHELVWELAEHVAEWKPDLVPFFATGGIPYLIPVMHILEREGLRTFLDGRHFHLFPGLAWGGSIEKCNSETYFTFHFGAVIRQNLATRSPLRVLVIDTTNSGNAVNNAVAACQEAVKASGASPGSVVMKVIGIVNTSHEEAKRGSDEKSIVTGAGRRAFVLTPSGFSPVSELVDRRFVVFNPYGAAVGFPFELAYWLAGNVPTEDRADLIGLKAVHETLSTKSIARAGRIKIDYGSGETQHGTGHGHLPGRLISLLSLPLDAWQWDKMREINRLPPPTSEEQEERKEIKELSEGGLRWIELNSMDRDAAVAGLAKLPRLLSDAEVYWLRTLASPPQSLASKVRASLEKGRCTATEAVQYFRRAFPEFASGDPGGNGSASWWNDKIRSTPKDYFTTDHQAPKQSDDSQSDAQLDDPALSEEGEGVASLADESVLDFVVIVGGVEEARKSLSDLRSRGMSLAEIEKHLDDTWPITADKALGFTGPTNEQAAMNFVLEWGGWEQAVACLEGWIVNDTGGV